MLNILRDTEALRRKRKIAIFTIAIFTIAIFTIAIFTIVIFRTSCHALA